MKGYSAASTHTWTSRQHMHGLVLWWASQSSTSQFFSCSKTSPTPLLSKAGVLHAYTRRATFVSHFMHILSINESMMPK